MLPKATILSLAQFVILQGRDDAALLLEKHGFDVRELERPPLPGLNAVSIIREIISNGDEEQLKRLLQEIARTRNDLRYKVKPRYRFDERFQDLTSRLAQDGFRIEQREIKVIDAKTGEGASFSHDPNDAAQVPAALVTPARSVSETSRPAPKSKSPANTPGRSRRLEVFVSYAHEDDELRAELGKQLKLLERQEVITSWHDRKITAGAEWMGQIDTHLESAHVILLLISADFLASDYCYDIELKRAMERHRAGEARVIPIILRACEWHDAAFGQLQALPKDGAPVTTWINRDEAFADVTRGIRSAVEEMG